MSRTAFRRRLLSAPAPRPARRRLVVTELEGRAVPAFYAAGDEFPVATAPSSGRSNVAVAADATGDFVVAWQSSGQDGSGYGVYAQRYNAAGAAQGAEFRVNTYTTGHQYNPAVAMDTDGDLVVAWQSNGQAGNATGVYAQRYLENEAPVLTDGAELPAVLQGVADPPGRKVASLFAGLVADPDAGDTLSGIAVTLNPNDGEQGTWEYSTDGVAWFPVGAVADGPTALALSAATRLRFAPAPWFAGEPTALAVRALDSSYAGGFTAGATRQAVDTTATGGTTPLSAAVAAVRTTVFPNPTGGAWLSPGGNLRVEGTAGNDAVLVKPSKDQQWLVVTLNKAAVGTYPVAAVTGRVVVHGLGGDDKLVVNGKVAVGADLYGGAGNDVLVGGSGDDLLVGGAGNDKLSGGLGANVLIGGAGADKLTGGSGDDLLVGGATAFDLDPTGLAAVRAEWASGDSYASRVEHLTAGGGVNGSVVLTAGTTATDDGSKDVLKGAAGSDWFVAGALDTLDLKAGEEKLGV